jgi:transposase
MSFVHPSYAAIVIVKWQGKFNGKEINSVLRCSNNECGITIDRDINGARNIFMSLEKMIQKERRPEAFCRSKINGLSNNSKP